MTRNESSLAGMVAVSFIIGVVGLALFIVGIGVLSPAAAQGLAYSLLVATPSIPIGLGIGGALIFAGAAIDTFAGDNSVLTGTPLAILGVLVVVLLGVLVGPFVGGLYMKSDMSDDVDAEKLNTLPKADQNHTRVMPRAVADKNARNSMRSPRYNLGESDITYYNGSYHWSYPKKPDGIANSLTRKQDGMKLVGIDSTTTAPKSVSGEFDRGIGMGWYDSAQNAYAMDLGLKGSRATGTSFQLYTDDGMYNAQSYITHEWRFRAGPIPMVYAVPQMGGVQMLDQDGSVETLSHEEAVQDERLKGQNFYPYYLAKLKMTTQAYQHGWLNTVFGHKDQLVLADTPAPDNDQPFVQFTEQADHPMYTILAEPWGSSTNGIYEVWLIDGQTGQAYEYNPDADGGLIGPARAAEEIRGQAPNNNWGSGGNIQVSEVHTVFRNGTMWYKGSVVTTDNSYSYTAFVNAETKEVYTYKEDKEVIGFANGNVSPEEVVQSTENQSNDGSSGPIDSSGMVVLVTDENGNVVDTVEVSANQSVTVQTGNSTSAATAGA